MHTTVYQFWRFVYHHEQSVIDHYARISLYTLSFCTKIRLHVYHLSWPHQLSLLIVHLLPCNIWKRNIKSKLPSFINAYLQIRQMIFIYSFIALNGCQSWIYLIFLFSICDLGVQGPVGESGDVWRHSLNKGNWKAMFCTFST